jgi:hypothetical protein
MYDVCIVEKNSVDLFLNIIVRKRLITNLYENLVKFIEIKEKDK